MSKEKQKFFRLSAFNCDRSQGPNPLSPRASGEGSGSKKSKSENNSMIRLGVKVSKLSDTSEDDDDDQNSGGSAVASAAGGASSHAGKSGATQKEGKRNGDVNERLSDSSSSCSSSNDSSSSSDSCSDDDSSDDSDEDSSSLSSNSSLSSSYEPDPGAKPPGGGGGSSGKGHDKFSSKKGSLHCDPSLSLQKKSANAGGSGSSRGTFSFTDFSEKNESDGVWGFAAEAKKSAEIFATPPSSSTANERVFGSFAEDEKVAGSSSGTAAGNKTPASSRGRKPAQREVMKETRNTFNRDFAGAETPSAVKRRISKAQSDSNNNTNATSKKAVAIAETKQKGGDAVPATPRAALNEIAANDNFVSPSGSGSRATTTSSPPYSIYGQNSIGKDAIPIISHRG